ncbi:exonuclease II Exo2 [Schizosaccharomyces japonicus yFS275]|uniref:5'-3' exoribonuclease 1 n=1 Tax=Schizosaccharomyces japonicus (strain yFS275 / FY16936) TaxID=402676 RepID=B6K3T5_SCHJY|nr:exonuclease II Exo2 [Schizosaccharomyces japonicus yFS275]EEB08142.1 exonuclease II Exo2 [Schizosaccharomyces japonicus yFS275]
MGIPKFFRWMSERYPLCSQLVQDDRIPEFDNLYLDMNGILHNCTHKNDDHSSAALPEDQMYIAIFNYIEHLFQKIKPKKLLYMAVDGCAPRAKMNQQRSRRFRTAKDAYDARRKAERNGEVIAEDPFDSNCITPGTVFMQRISEQLHYFIQKKVSEDSDWSGVQIILSGHDCPGEGEHKIMEYIRTQKAQPNYNPNTRHCLYGLDADLIMLGLLSHDPHFCLLREEVTFGPARKSASKELANQKFYLLHLSLLREYLEAEFEECRDNLPFAYDLERIIDDFILLAFFVGNDFLPNLPGLHINEGALALMFNVYKSVLPLMEGYINEAGVINMDRLDLVLLELEKFEKAVFKEECYSSNADGEAPAFDFNQFLRNNNKDPSYLTVKQKELYCLLKKFLYSREQYLDITDKLSSEDTRFLRRLASKLGLMASTVVFADGSSCLRVAFKNLNFSDSEEDDEEQDEIGEVLEKFDKLNIIDNTTKDSEEKFEKGFEMWKDNYYRSKVGFSYYDEKELEQMAKRYVEGLQWVLFYYYRGCQSWGWFYDYHYSPKISDVRRGLRFGITFDMGKPFRPFEQLMAVLPARSKSLVPPCYRDLMTDPNSPIIDFYPENFELDQNEKKASWEAVVKIPFIEETRLQDALKSREHLLTAAELHRNEFHPPVLFIKDDSITRVFPSSLPNIFPDLLSHCIEVNYSLPSMQGLEYRVGLCPGVFLGTFGLAGFPSFHTVKHTAEIASKGVNVFGNDSRNPSVIVHVQNIYNSTPVEELAKKYLNQKVFMDWPYLRESKSVALTTSVQLYTMEDGNLNVRELTSDEISLRRRKIETLNRTYFKRYGVILGPVDVVLVVHPLKGMQFTRDGALIKSFDSDSMEVIPIQILVDKIAIEDARYTEREAPPVELEFPVGTKVFNLGEYNYGRPAQVTQCKDNKLSIWLSTAPGLDATWGTAIVRAFQHSEVYYPSYIVARKLGLHPLALSKITSRFVINVDKRQENVGLSLKFDARQLKVIGYTRKTQSGWEFSEAAIKLLAEYMHAFPDFFQALNRLPSKDSLTAKDYFPHDDKGKVAAMKQWLKQNKVSEFTRVSLSDYSLTKEAIQQIEAKADSIDATFQVPKKVFGVPRYAVLKPSQAAHVLHSQTFALGDRIVYVQDSGKVPIAAYGTVVGISTHQLEVVFDLPFMSGTTLDGKCSPYRGMQLDPSTVLNITQPQLLITTRAGQARKKKLESNIHSTTPSKLVTKAQYNHVPPPPSLNTWKKSPQKSRNTRGPMSPGKALNKGPAIPDGQVSTPSDGTNQHSTNSNTRGRGRGPRRGNPRNVHRNVSKSHAPQKV